MKLPPSFFLRTNVLEISKDLLGKFLFTNFDGIVTGGMIVETEAYRAPEDKASHAHGGRRTPRTETFYLQGGVSYVYLCYGIHHLFNIVTNEIEVPHAILIRAIEPTEGIPEMMLRRNKKKLDRTLTAGPGAMSQALGIHVKHNAYDLQGNTIWLEDRGIRYKPAQIGKGPRIGVAYAQEYAEKPWRFWVKGNTYVSKQ